MTDVVVYVLVQPSVTASELKESAMFQQLHIKGVRSWKDIWNTEPFQKTGRLIHMHPTYQWLEDVRFIASYTFHCGIRVINL